MVGQGTVTASEEILRYYRKAKNLAQPVINQITTTNEASLSRSGPETAEPMFDNDVAYEDGDWVEIIGAEQTPEENNQESHRLATGTGPIQAAGGVLVHKVTKIGHAAANRASQAPGAMKLCAENQTERLAEVVGRVSVSSTVAGVLQRYPLLERWRVAFFRGRESGSEGDMAASAPLDHQSGMSDEQLLAELPLTDAGDEEMEDVPLGEVIDQEENGWEKAQQLDDGVQAFMGVLLSVIPLGGNMRSYELILTKSRD